MRVSAHVTISVQGCVTLPLRTAEDGPPKLLQSTSPAGTGWEARRLTVSCCARLAAQSPEFAAFVERAYAHFMANDDAGEQELTEEYEADVKARVQQLRAKNDTIEQARRGLPSVRVSSRLAARCCYSSACFCTGQKSSLHDSSWVSCCGSIAEPLVTRSITDDHKSQLCRHLQRAGECGAAGSAGQVEERAVAAGGRSGGAR